MSKVISFSISDKYLEKLRTLYPDSTDNLAVKQFVTDRLDGSLDDVLDDKLKTIIESSLSSSLDDALDDVLDDKLKTIIETSLDGLLDERLDATVGKLISSLTERLTRLESRLDDGLDDMEPLLRLQREASIASPIPPSPDEPAIEDVIEPLTVEVVNEANSSIESVTDAIKTVLGEPDSTIDTESGAIETLPGDTSPTDEPVEQNLTNKKIASILGIDNSNLSKWLKTKIIPEKYRDKCQFNHNKTKIVLI